MNRLPGLRGESRPLLLAIEIEADREEDLGLLTLPLGIDGRAHVLKEDSDWVTATALIESEARVVEVGAMRLVLDLQRG